MNDYNPVYIMMVGVPASGKSTFIKEYFGDNAHVDYQYYSSDHEIEEFARVMGKTYNEVFFDRIVAATDLSLSDLKDAITHSVSVIDDHTNTSAKKRKSKLNNLPDNYIKIAFVFSTPEADEWQRRLDNRPGKTIPKNVLESMATNLTNPSYDEGFDIICHIQ
jgi:predicted kinase